MNDNYADFLSLGTSLSGGEEKIEEVRVGLLGFERDVQQLREKVVKERERVADLVREKKQVLREMAVGRGLLEIEQRVGELEVDIGLRGREIRAPVVVDTMEEGMDDPKEEWGDDWKDEEPVESDDEYENDEQSAVSTRLRKRAEQFLMIVVLMERYDPNHPFLLAEQGRIRRLRQTLLLDLDAAIRAESEVQGKQEIMRLRSSVEE